MRLAAGKEFEASAVLFDMDGTLVDSRSAVEAIWTRWAQRYGLGTEEVLAYAHGRPSRDTISRFGPVGLDVESEASSFEDEEVAVAEGIHAIKGATSLCEALPLDGWAVVTSAGRRLAYRRMRLAGVQIPSVLISADEVEHGKPHPEGYLMAAGELRVDASECLVFEDTVPGLTAGRNGGSTPIAVATTMHSAELTEWPWIEDFSRIQFVGVGDKRRLRFRIR